MYYVIRAKQFVSNLYDNMFNIPEDHEVTDQPW